MLDWLEIYTWDDFATYLRCVAQVAAVVLPIAIILWILIKLLILGLDNAYGCVVRLNHKTIKRKKGK